MQTHSEQKVELAKAIRMCLESLMVEAHNSGLPDLAMALASASLVAEDSAMAQPVRRARRTAQQRAVGESPACSVESSSEPHLRLVWSRP